MLLVDVSESCLPDGSASDGEDMGEAWCEVLEEVLEAHPKAVARQARCTVGRMFADSYFGERLTWSAVSLFSSYLGQ